MKITDQVADERLREIVTEGERQAANGTLAVGDAREKYRAMTTEQVAIAHDLLNMRQVRAINETLPPRVHERIAKALERIADFLEGGEGIPPRS